MPRSRSIDTQDTFALGGSSACDSAVFVGLGFDGQGVGCSAYIFVGALVLLHFLQAIVPEREGIPLAERIVEVV